MEKEFIEQCYNKALELNAEFFNDGLIIRNKNYKGTITYYQPNYIEIEVVDDKGENIFYQQLEDIDALRKEIADSFRNFYHCLYDDIEKKEEFIGVQEPRLYDFKDGKGPRLPKVLVTCTSGASSSLYANLFKNRMLAHGIDLDITALDIESAKEKIDEYDGVLLAPQVSYYFDELREKYGEKILKIPSNSFSTMDTSDYEKGLIK